MSQWSYVASACASAGLAWRGCELVGVSIMSSLPGPPILTEQECLARHILLCKKLTRNRCWLQQQPWENLALSHCPRGSCSLLTLPSLPFPMMKIEAQTGKVSCLESRSTQGLPLGRTLCNTHFVLFRSPLLASALSCLPAAARFYGRLLGSAKTDVSTALCSGPALLPILQGSQGGLAHREWPAELARGPRPACLQQQQLRLQASL